MKVRTTKPPFQGQPPRIAMREAVSGELGIFRRLAAAFEPGDMMLADALYCNEFLVAMMFEAGVDVRFAQNGARNTDFRRGRSMGSRDHRVAGPSPQGRPDWMTPEQGLRNLKTTMGMEVLRLLLAQAAHEVDLDPRDLSFRHTVQACIECRNEDRNPTQGPRDFAPAHDAGSRATVMQESQSRCHSS